MRDKGITFISVLIALFILTVGILYLVRVYPVIDKLSDRGKTYLTTLQIADRLFTLIEEVYGNADGPPVPSFITGTDERFPLYSYSINIREEKEGLYRIEMEIERKQEGKSETSWFTGSFRRR